MTRIEFLGLMASAALAPGAASAVPPDDERPAPGVHPRVYMTPADVRRARENVRRYAWAKAERDAILTEADRWLAYEEGWLLKQMPAAGACFAYGLTGCPICGASWGTWWGAKASFDTPGKVTCAQGHTLPDAAHPDPGTGYVAPDGRIHYFVGSYNAWVIEKMIFGGANHLAYAYSLTGDNRYADRCALLLDAIARIYPACNKGSWDYPSDPPSGRLDRPWYQVSRVLVHLTDQYDQVFHADAALEKPSLVPGLTRRKNIEENLIRNGAAYCYEQSVKNGTLNNGNADYIRGALAVGLCLGIPEYVQYAVDSPCGVRTLLDNNLDRDGRYYETSPLYAGHSRELYLSFAEPLANFRGDANYPDGVDLYAHPRLRRFLTLDALAQGCCGHMPRYGDSAPDTKAAPAPERPFEVRDVRALEHLYARCRDRAGRDQAGRLLLALSGSDMDTLRNGADSLNTIVGGGFTADRCWLLFHAGDPPKGDTHAAQRDLSQQLAGSALFGQKGFGILRRGEGASAQALLLRYGPSLNHGHIDDLNLNFFSHGYEVTYDLGYGLASTHTQVGWARQTAAHNLVVVNEESQAGPGSGGSLHLFAELPSGLRVMEASSEASYSGAGVDLYRRAVLLIDGFMVDLFRVRGGNRHDYVFHALAPRAEVTGLTLSAEEAGSLAGPEYAWGDQQLNDGDMKGYPNKPYWIPPPGNGYGFLGHARRSSEPAISAFHAEWTVDADTRLRLHVAPESSTDEVVTAEAPGIVAAQPRAGYLLMRRRAAEGVTRLESRFAAVAEPYAAKTGATIARIERIAVEESAPGAAGGALALRIARTDGSSHLVYSALDASSRTAATGISATGRLLHIRRNAAGELVALEAVGASHFAADGWEITADRDAWRGEIVALEDGGQGVLTVRIADGADLPTTLTGRVVQFSHPRYSRNTAYRIARVERTGKGGTRLYLDAPLDLGRGVVGQMEEGGGAFTTPVPHEYTRVAKRKDDAGFLTGKRLRVEGENGIETFVKAIRRGAPDAIVVENAAGLRPGDQFRYWDLTPGDRFEILTQFALIRSDAGRYRLEGDTSGVTVRPPTKDVRIERARG